MQISSEFFFPLPKVLYFLSSRSFSFEETLVNVFRVFFFFSVQQKKASVWLFSPVSVLVLPVG